jgi:hypothetical protein
LKSSLLDIAERIRCDLDEIELLVERAIAGWQKFLQTDDELYLDSVALSLHSFYSGLERLFEIIATRIDGERPEGNEWHYSLLMQMSKDLSDIRPAVISEIGKEMLNGYRKFRHVVRHVYAFDFDPEIIGEGVSGLVSTFELSRRELIGFAEFLEEQSKL